MLWVGVYFGCMCAWLCVLWIASNLSWITFAVGVYRMVGWHAVSQRGLEITRIAGVWILSVCACMRVHTQVLFGILAHFSSHLSCMLYLSSEWLTDQHPAALFPLLNMGLAVSSIYCMVFVVAYKHPSIENIMVTVYLLHSLFVMHSSAEL